MTLPKFTEEELSTRPPSKLPDGRNNSEYQKWYRKTAWGSKSNSRYQTGEKAAAARRRYQTGEKGKKSLETYRNKPEVKEHRRITAAKRYRERYPTGSRSCVDCGVKFSNEHIDENQYKVIGRYSCLCDICDDSV